ncbi:MAG: bifunctional folylpolyglutamate synthase/dihydrofolate synthase [Candidatus Rokuibacteriota bacterium]
MTAAEALAWLLRLSRFERSGMQPGLTRIHALLDTLGHPEADLRILHVGGTNGKGSVSALAEAILRAAGLRTGLYTSPHLLDVTERIRIAGVPISHEALAGYVQALQPRLEAEGSTFFEAVTAVALAAFRDAGVEAAVLEVGLGGRWDATNVGAPLASVITRIDYDHQEYLGYRLEEIAAEKAAIIKGGVALSAAQAPEAMAVVEARCRALGVPLLVEGRDLSVEVVSADLRGHRLHVAGPGRTLRHLELALLGLFQPANAVLAIGAVRAFAAAAGLAVDEAAIRHGSAGVRWPGRFQVIAGATGRPTVVLDGAHNPAGGTALAASLVHYFPGARLTLLLGISKDKDRAGILKALAPLARHIVLTASTNVRATPPAELAAELPPVEARVTLMDDPGRALRLLVSDDADVVCVAGSLFLVADALRWLADYGLLASGGPV